jgi:ankyrin repeat protein
MSVIEKIHRSRKGFRRILDKAFDILFCGLVLYLLLNIHAFDDFLFRVAAESGYNGPVKALIYLGANVHADDDQALKVATNEGHTEVVKTLLNQGAGTNVDKGTLVFLAARAGHFDTAEFLLENGAVTCGSESFWLRIADQTKNTKIANNIRQQLARLPSLCHSNEAPGKNPSPASQVH